MHGTATMRVWLAVGALVAVIAVPGCSSGSGSGSGYEDPTGKSGTRLRRRYVEGGPGAYRTMDFWDTELETACTFGEAADGAMRCLPFTDLAVLYSDAGCTSPVFEVAETETGCARAWGREEGTRAYYRSTETPAVITGSTVYYLYESTCYSGSIADGYAYWAAELVPSASFVRGTLADEARTDGMVARFVDGDDGSRELVAAMHGTLGYPCAFDDDRYCVPEVDARTVYLDSGCTDAAVEVRSAGVPPLLALREVDGSGCAAGFSYYARGAALSPPLVYLPNTSGVCTAYAAPHAYYELGAPIALETFPQASLQNEGEGLVQARRFVDDDGAPLARAHVFWDTTRDEECEPGRTTATGDHVCVTASRGYVTGQMFEDAACTASMTLASSACMATAPRLLMDPGYSLCPEVEGVLEVSAVFERGTEAGPDYYIGGALVTCEARTASPAQSLYRLGPDALGSLPPLTLAME